jgi:hypothetical protein
MRRHLDCKLTKTCKRRNDGLNAGSKLAPCFSLRARNEYLKAEHRVHMFEFSRQKELETRFQWQITHQSQF